jgi:N-acetyl-anhydromuramyl-L-alanine amidase AmpD
MSGVFVDKSKMYDIELNFQILVQSGVSAHYIIDREGVIYQLVEEGKRAWHAGASELDGEKDVNQFSVGIELLATHTSGFTDKQYDSVIKLCKDIKKDYNITDNRFRGHEHICIPLGRKLDPGPEFQWDRFFAGLNNKEWPLKVNNNEAKSNIDDSNKVSSINKADSRESAQTQNVFYKWMSALANIIKLK